MKVENVLKEFIEECLKKINFKTVIQFGSSTYSKNYNDIDLLLCSSDSVLRTNDIFELIKIIKNFESRYKDIVFDFGGINRKRSGNFFITTVFIGEDELEVAHNPHDLFFFKNLSLDENKKIWHGKDLFMNKKFTLTNQHLFEMLSVDLKHTLRESLDDEEYRLSSTFVLFKTFLRGMLINYNIIRKEKLISSFEKFYKAKIDLPSGAIRILNNNLKGEDFENVLRFCEACLNHLRG